MTNTKLIAQIMGAYDSKDYDGVITRIKLHEILKKYDIAPKSQLICRLEYRVVRRNSEPKPGEYYSNNENANCIYGPCGDAPTVIWAVIFERKEIYDE